MPVFEAKQDRPHSNMDSSAAHRRNRRYALLRPVLDACTAFALFVIVSLALSSGPTSASPHRLLIAGTPFTQVANPKAATPGDLQRDRQIFQIAAYSQPAATDAAFRQTDALAAWLLLSFAFSLLAALNMALVRHLRQAYSNPRKRN